MSYRLINSNKLAIKYPEVNDMPCIYADIPNGLNGDFYDLSVYPKIVENLEQPTVDVLKQIRAEIEQEISNASSVDYINGLNVALMIINEKYR
jgi:lantibiotic modifying enzyme